MTPQDPCVFDTIASAYDATRSLPPDVMNKVIMTLSDSLGGGPVLDVGVGTGRFAAPLARLGIDVVGIDLAVKMMALAREKGFRNVAMASATEMPFRDGAFESATMVHVLHLIPDWQRALAEISRTVRGSLFTVATVMEKLHEPRAIYERRLEAFGYGKAYLGMHEKELAKLLEPDVSAKICDHVVTLPADAYIGSLERREYSWATRLPDELHNEVVAEIRREVGGTVESVRGEIFILGWKSSRFNGLAGITEPAPPSR
jgi:ubiquinone/menaquinone biosynthesis C-methylase UbiE